MEIHDERVKTKRAAPFIYSDLPLITHALFLFLSFSSHLALPLVVSSRRAANPTRGGGHTARCILSHGRGGFPHDNAVCRDDI